MISSMKDHTQKISTYVFSLNCLINLKSLLIILLSIITTLSYSVALADDVDKALDNVTTIEGQESLKSNIIGNNVCQIRKFNLVVTEGPQYFLKTYMVSNIWDGRIDGNGVLQAKGNLKVESYKKKPPSGFCYIIANWDIRPKEDFTVELTEGVMTKGEDEMERYVHPTCRPEGIKKDIYGAWMEPDNMFIPPIGLSIPQDTTTRYQCLYVVRKDEINKCVIDFLGKQYPLKNYLVKKKSK